MSRWTAGILAMVPVALVAGAARGADEVKVPEASRPCIACHEKQKVGATAIEEWRLSTHAKQGVACLDCHAARQDEPDAFDHHGKRIATIVTPNDCAACHERESREFQGSHHAKAGEILGSLDNVLGEVVEGTPAAVSGCRGCHGGRVSVRADGRPDPITWPNTGIGRLNPDGSRGACSACHSRHLFSAKVARSPESCGKCHRGPDHPQMEIFQESKHGVAFYVNRDRMNLGAERWVVGRDYSAAPTCATCHASATPDLPATHDPGERIAWTLRPAVSKRLDGWEKRRASMKLVCINCHAAAFADNHFTQFDIAVDLYNEKFAKPAADLMKRLYDAKVITATLFDDPIEWTYYELWHHEGRRARHGAAMMGPDHTQWHGFYEVAKAFYTELMPQAEEKLPGSTATLRAMDDHGWLKGIDAGLRDKVRKFYEGKYGR